MVTDLRCPHSIGVRSIGRWSALLLACATLVVPLRAGQDPPAAAGDTPFVYQEGLAWPGGGTVTYARQSWQVKRTAAERLRLFPESPHTVGWLSNADRMDDALTVLARVVERHPARVAEALEGFKAHEIQSDQTRGYKARVRDLVTVARRKLPEIDREAAAKMARSLLTLEQVSAETYQEWNTRLVAFVRAYPDTEAARLAEVDLTTFTRPSLERLAELDAAREHDARARRVDALFAELGRALAQPFPGLAQVVGQMLGERGFGRGPAVVRLACGYPLFAVMTLVTR